MERTLSLPTYNISACPISASTVVNLLSFSDSGKFFPSTGFIIDLAPTFLLQELQPDFNKNHTIGSILEQASHILQLSSNYFIHTSHIHELVPKFGTMFIPLWHKAELTSRLLMTLPLLHHKSQSPTAQDPNLT